MDWGVLGPVEIIDNGQPVPLGGPKQIAILAILLINAGKVVSTETLVDEVWPDAAPETARKTIQTYIARLRRELNRGADRPVVRSAATGYILNVEHAQADFVRFEGLVSRARSAIENDPEGASALLEDALDLWRGRAFESAYPTGVIEQEAARLDELRLEALECRADSRIRAGRASAVVPELRALVDAHPLRERLWALLILAYHQSGRHADALRAAAEVRRLLREELGADPGLELRRLEQAVLQRDRALEPPQRAQPAVAPPRPRWRRKAVPWLAAAGVVLAGALAIAGTGLLPSHRAGPQVGARLLVPPGSTDAVAAGGKIWVLVPEAGQVVSVDPQTGETTPYDLGHRPSAIAAGLGSLWVASEADGHLAELDAATGRLRREVDGLNLAGVSLSVGHDTVWVVREDRQPFLAIDPRDLGVSPAAFSVDSPPVLPGVAVAADVLWGANAEIGRVLWLDPDSGEYGFAGDARVADHAARSIAVDRGAVWFSQPTNGSITRVDAATHQVTAVVEIGEPSGSGFPLFREPYTLAAGPGGLWAALPEDGVVVRLDERTGEVTARISLGEPVALAPMAGAVWVLDRQFTQLVRIDTETCDRLPFIGPRADLRGCDLAGAVLIGVDLSGADLRWATIGLSPMQQADLTDADLRGSDLQHATLDGATWSSTICPDGSLSDDNGGSCLGHLRP